MEMDSGLLKQKETNWLWELRESKGKLKNRTQKVGAHVALKIQVAGTNIVPSRSCCGMNVLTISPSLFTPAQDSNSGERRADRSSFKG